MYYLNNFFLFSILGHIIETIIYAFHKGESGILFGPWTPIYGIGVLIIIVCYQFLIKDRIENKWLKNIAIFLIGFLLLSFIEWLGGILIESIFGIVFWTYKDLKFNIGHYIALEMAIIWGIASLILVHYILPFTDKITKKIPRFITWLLTILFIIDNIVTLIFKIK